MSQGRHALVCKEWLCHLKNMYSLVSLGMKTIPLNVLCEAMSHQGGGWLASVMSFVSPWEASGGHV